MLSLDVYLPSPRPATPSRPLLVVHGGFWSAGRRGEASMASRRLADLGFTVFDVEYRLAPPPNWQTAVGDVKCAIGWVKQHATNDDWNVDPNRVALLGRSAGGHLVLMAGLRGGGSASLPPSCAAGDTSVDAVIALYAPDRSRLGLRPPFQPARRRQPGRSCATSWAARPNRAPDRYRALSPAARVTAGGAAHAAGARRARSVRRPRRSTGSCWPPASPPPGVPHETLFIPWAQHAFDFGPAAPRNQLLEPTLRRFPGRRRPLTTRPRPPRS